MSQKFTKLKNGGEMTYINTLSKFYKIGGETTYVNTITKYIFVPCLLNLLSSIFKNNFIYVNLYKIDNFIYIKIQELNF